MSPFDGYRITSPYGWRVHPIYGDRRFHTGIDLVKPHKSPIGAFAEGEVVYAAFGASGTGLGGLGNVVCIKGKGTDHLHVYGHLDSVSVKRGQQVKKGQEVGKQGSTGDSTGSHLHYEVRKKSSPSYGYSSVRDQQCFEPTQYLIDLNKKLEAEKPQPKPEPPKPKYAVYLGNVQQKEFPYYGDAVAYAEKLKDAHIRNIETGAWVWSNIEKESEDNKPMKLENWEKAMIKDSVITFSKTPGKDGKMVIDSPDKWIKAVDNETLSAKDLSVLNLAIITRTVG